MRCPRSPAPRPALHRNGFGRETDTGYNASPAPPRGQGADDREPDPREDAGRGDGVPEQLPRGEVEVRHDGALLERAAGEAEAVPNLLSPRAQDQPNCGAATMERARGSQPRE